MDVSRVSGVNGAYPVRPAQQLSDESAQESTGAIKIPQDQLEISEAARMLSDLNDSSEISADRAELIARIRTEIDQGVYDTSERLDIALSRAIDQIQQVDE